MSQTESMILFIVLGILALTIFLFGIIFLFTWALEQGFIGVAAFIACWVFMWPVMLGITGVVGLILFVMWLWRFFTA